MSKNTIYIIATVLALIVVVLLAKPKTDETAVAPDALPTNGMVEGTTTTSPEAMAPVAPSGVVPTMPDGTPAPGVEGTLTPAPNTTDVPPAAEGTETPVPTAPAEGTMTPSEGQQ